MKALITIQQKYKPFRFNLDKGETAWTKLAESDYDEQVNKTILQALTPYAKGQNQLPSWFKKWNDAPLEVKGQAIYTLMMNHRLCKNIHPMHIKGLIATFAFESKLNPLIINSSKDGINSSLIKSGETGGIAFGLDQRISSRKYDIIDRLVKSDGDIFSLADIRSVVDFILNDINSNPDMAPYKAVIMKSPVSPRQCILNAVQLYEGLSSKYADQWYVEGRLTLYNIIF